MEGEVSGGGRGPLREEGLSKQMTDPRVDEPEIIE